MRRVRGQLDTSMPGPCTAGQPPISLTAALSLLFPVAAASDLVAALSWYSLGNNRFQGMGLSLAGCLLIGCRAQPPPSWLINTHLGDMMPEALVSLRLSRGGGRRDKMEFKA